METRDKYQPSVLLKMLYERSKTIENPSDADLMYQASLTIGVQEAKLNQLLHSDPDDDLHG